MGETILDVTIQHVELWLSGANVAIRKREVRRVLDALAAEREAHEATRGEVARLWSALYHHGAHDACAAGQHGEPEDARCNCGLAAALREPPIGTGYGKPSNSPAEKLDLDTGPAR